MPGRQSHGGAPTKKLKARAPKNKKRAQNAFAIAVQENEEKPGVRRSRLGHSEGDERPKKRVRDEDEEEDEDEESGPRKQQKRRSDDLNIDAGSDSEGNEWRMGELGSDDEDSDLDSDEAFGESDEERFDGYAFSGSSKKPKQKSKGAKTKILNLDEEESEMDDVSGSDDDSLGDDAIDLATMLDQTAEDSEEGQVAEKTNGAESSEEEEDSEDDDDNDDSSASSMDDDDAQDPEKLAALKTLIANLSREDSNRGPKQQRTDGASEYNAPSDFGVTSKTKLTLEDLGLASVRDPNIKKSLKLFDADSKKKSATLAVPLARRQQDRLDRAAAYDKSKETLDRWTDTVKHNRRAEHLVFPLPDQDAAAMSNGNTQLRSTTTAKPFNELEAAIQSIMEESGLATANGKDDEDKILEYEELQANKMSLEEVKARRDQLRMARELMFREEAKSKRIKKIKSKSYRKVHRKQREREEQKEKEALLEAGFVPSEDEQEAQDRRRATERMGDKHRGSRWAKATKALGRAAWDEDARAGISEMARRDEELRKRVEGKTSRRDEEGDSESSYDDSDDESDEDVKKRKFLGKLDSLQGSESQSGPGAKLANMKFMLKADASKKQANDEMVEQMKRELAGEESDEAEDLDTDIGRRSFGPSSTKNEAPKKPQRREFEEPEDSDAEEVEFNIGTNNTVSNSGASARSNFLAKPSHGSAGGLKTATRSAADVSEDDHEGGAWSKVLSTKKDAEGMSESKRRKQRSKATDTDELDITNAAMIARMAKPSKKSKPGVKFMKDQEPDDSDSEDGVRLPFVIKDQELIKRAFAGADVVGDFEAEKRQTIEDEDEKVVDDTLPGWGNWTGDGLSKKEKKKNTGRFLTKTDGIKEANRKDAKLERVIINEKRVKKNGKYLAAALPHPFETRQQYERSLRLPVGPEWTTKETFQDATKPRILLKQGIIAPMSKPLL